ncbi:putative disease resistance protein (TIR-NBS-LRR class), partial [Trifolium medium]|nr:putative disease resistance protein (TIR-NBS-LRR class) [Trifolium medium]
RFLNQDHTFLWKHQLDLETIGSKLFHAQNFTLEFPSKVKVKECGICPLYTKENDDNSIEEPSGSKDAP